MNIRVDLNTPIKDGMDVLFRSPVDCSQITGLVLYYNGESQEFAFTDAHGNNVGDVDHLFAENVVVKVILDVAAGKAFVQNADTNAYLEGRFQELEDQIRNGGDHSMYFSIDFDGVVSLKDDYKADGALNAELPETIIIPDVIDGTAVSAFTESMFENNLRVKSITIPNSVLAIPKKFANKAYNLEELKGTENVKSIGQAAFQHCGIKKALFPNLKEFVGGGFFNCAANLTIVDIGNYITEIPSGCFAGCESLSLVIGGESVTSVGATSFKATRSLKNLSFVGNLKSIGKEAFLLSRVNFDWWTLKNNLPSSAFGDTTKATPAHFNPTKWWEFTDGYTPTACENPLGSTFNQHHPDWIDIQIPGSADTYGSGCVEIATAHIYSALAEVKLVSPRHFVENIVGGIDNGRLLKPVKGTEYSGTDVVNWLEALGMQCEHLTSYNSTNLEKIYKALDEYDALIFTGIYPGHAGVIYGIASNGEVLVLDSGPNNYFIGDYTARTFQQPIWSLVQGSTQGAIIVKKKEV